MKLFQAKFDFYPERRLARIRYEGDFALGAVEGAIGGLLQNPDFRREYRRFYDLRDLVNLPPKPPGMEALLGVIIASDPPVARRAVVATGYVAELCQVFAELAGPLVQVFGDEEEALRWVLAGET